jgi:uncharacterized iron-regulated membrane protein
MLVLLHRWLGVFAGSVLILLSLSGFLLLWMDEYLDWRYPALPDNAGLISPDARLIEEIFLSADPQVVSLGMPTASRPFYLAYLAGGEQQVYHPTSGELLASWTWIDSVPLFLFELHARLILGEVGHLAVGVTGIFCVISMVSGLLVWWRRRRLFRVRFLLPTSAHWVQLLKSHAAQGVAMSLLFLATSVTGIAMVFPDPFRVALNYGFGVSGTLRPQVWEVAAHSGEIDWSHILAVTEKALPNAALRFVTPPRTDTSTLMLRLRMPTELHPNGRSYLAVVPKTGEILQVIRAPELGMGPMIFDAFYPVHSGKTNWFGHRFVLGLVSLSLLYLAVSGLSIFVQRGAFWRRH